MRRVFCCCLLALTCCVHPRSTLILVADGAAPLYVCCDDDGCVGVVEAASCGPSSQLFSCEAGETTMVDGKPAVVCHDQD